MDLTQLDVIFQRRRDRMEPEAPDPSEAWMSDCAAYMREAWPAVLGRMREDLEGPPPQPDLLVLVVGFSPPPLLLSIGWHRPRRVLLVGSESGGGEASLQHLHAFLRDEWDHFAGWKPEVLDPLPFPPTDTARAVSRIGEALRTWKAAHPHATVHMDITGGKKSMVAAMFFLACEIGARAVYVDGDYDEGLRMPRPGTERVVPLPDPVAVLALGGRRGVRHALEREDYVGAHQLLTTLIADIQAEDPEARALTRVDQLQRLAAQVEVCRYWSEGRYHEARQCFRNRRAEVPFVLDELGAFWEKKLHGDKFRDLTGDLRGHPGRCFLYVVDAWRWIRRSRFAAARDRWLRLFALGEYVLEAVLADHVGKEKVWFDGSPFQRSPSQLLRGLDGSRVAELLATGRVHTERSRFRKQGAVAPADEGAPPGKGDTTALLEMEDGVVLADCLGPWMDDDLRSIRNACAHDFAIVSDGMVEDLLGAVRVLTIQAASCWTERIQEGRAVRGDLRELVDGWFVDDGFEPAGLIYEE